MNFCKYAQGRSDNQFYCPIVNDIDLEGRRIICKGCKHESWSAKMIRKIASFMDNL